jgi:hypothetical protein
VVILEEVLRLGRRGPRLRPFCQSAGLKPRDSSRALQRALADFGAEESFARAAARVREHYGIEVGASTVRACTLKHGRSILKVAEKMQLPAASAIVTQIDGSLIPVVESASDAEIGARKRNYSGARCDSARPGRWAKLKASTERLWAAWKSVPACGGRRPNGLA